jgi:tRNA 2-selenouridine synthase
MQGEAARDHDDVAAAAPVEAGAAAASRRRERPGERPRDVATVAQIDLFDEVIDVRSPAEFADDHVPGARSFPVLSNDERAEIGTLHKQVSSFAAKKRGAVLVARNIAAHIERELHERPAGWKPLVYCWRGGKRSRAMAVILREIGWHAATLEGGYKAFRRHVIESLETLPARLRYVVVCGETGSAKSRLLAAAERAGAQVLDLEGLAQHRGSVLGGLPAAPQPAQRMFETLVWDRLRRFDPARPVLVESESRKIGALQVPEALIVAMRASPCVRVQAPLAARVRFLIEEYPHFLADRARLEGRLDVLRPLFGGEVVARWKDAAARGDWPGFVTDLLETHYDPSYRRSMARNFPALADAPSLVADSLDAASIEALAARLVAMAPAAATGRPAP